MIPIPAIDLKNGRVVRLLQGNFDEEKVYAEKPDEIARRFEAEGAERLHVVDLDGALAGEPLNLGLVETILRQVKIPVEVGGGIRKLEMIERYLEMGMRWVVLGTKACLDPGFLREALGEFKDRVIVGIDAVNGNVATDGWTKITAVKAMDLAAQVRDFGGKSVIYTDISKDGALAGPSLKEIAALSASVGTLDVIASGGVSSLGDLRNLIDLKAKNLIGAVIGKALYEKKFTLKDAVRLCREGR